MFLNRNSQNILSHWLGRFYEDDYNIDCFGGSVAHFAFNIADFMGSDNIVLVGQDLSFSSKKVHSKGVTDIFEEAVEKGVENIRDQTIGASRTIDIFNEDVLTRSDFLSFKTSYENKIKTFKGKVINATEAGLPIEGAIPMRFMDFIDSYCDLPEIDTFPILSKLMGGKVADNLGMIKDEVTAGRDKFNEIKNTANRILKHLKKIISLKKKGKKDSKEFHYILNKVEPLIEKVKHPLLNLLVGYHYSLELYLQRQDMVDIDAIEDKWERLDRQLERGENYYGEIVEAISLFNKQLDKLIPALQREKKVNAILSDEALKDSERFMKIGMLYKNAGAVRQSVEFLEAAEGDIQLTGDDSQITDLYVSMADMYIKQFRFYEAREILGKVRGDGSNSNSRIDKLLNTCEEKIEVWEAREKKMQQLLQDAEANYGSHLESGYFYFRIKDYKGAEKAYLKAIESMETNVEPYYGLAHTYLAMDDVEKAVEIFEKAIAIDPDNPILYRDLGLIAFENNNIEPAELFFRKAIELAPSEAELYKNLADLYINLGQREKAIELYENALQANADNPAILKDLALIYSEKITNAETV
jgi:tetratricopeptide (TPR) repeat protein